MILSMLDIRCRDDRDVMIDRGCCTP